MPALSLKERRGYLHIVGLALDLPVIGPPPLHRSTSPLTVFIAVGALHQMVVAATYEAGAEVLRKTVEGWVTGGPLVTVTRLAALAQEASQAHRPEPLDQLTTDVDDLRRYVAGADGTMKEALAATLSEVARLVQAAVVFQGSNHDQGAAPL